MTKHPIQCVHMQDKSYMIILVFCACVCLSVCVSVPPDISRMGGLIATLLRPSWRALPGELHELLSEPTQCVVREKKPLQVFRQLHAKSRASTVTHPVTLGRMNLAHYNKAVGTFQRVHFEGRPPHQGYHSCHSFLREWAIDTSQYKKLTTR